MRRPTNPIRPTTEIREIKIKRNDYAPALHGPGFLSLRDSMMESLKTAFPDWPKWKELDAKQQQ